MKAGATAVALLLALSLSGSDAASTEQGKGFKKPFYPGNSTRFFPAQSSSFSLIPGAKFELTYADNSKLVGYQGIDVVSLGSFYVKTKFGAITDCNSPDFNNVSGILGMGMPTLAPPGLPGMPNPGVPKPLLFDLSDKRIKNNKENHALPRRAFSFMSTYTEAELQLGGYDPDAVEGELFTTPSIQPTEYMVPVLSIKFGDVELLEFTEGDGMLQGVLDSGTSCLVMPDMTAGMLQDKPYSKWLSIVKDKKHPHVKDTFHINIAGHTFDIPFDTWYMGDPKWSVYQQSCVQKMPGGAPLVLIGDVLFRNYLVMFDLEPFAHGGPVMLGIGKQNKNYKLAKKKELVTKTFPKHATGHYEPPYAKSRLPVQNFECSQYFVNVSVGTPPQEMKVILDSGSSEFGVFSQCPKGASHNLRCDFGRAGVVAKASRRLLARPNGFRLRGAPTSVEDNE